MKTIKELINDITIEVFFEDKIEPQYLTINQSKRAMTLGVLVYLIALYNDKNNVVPEFFYKKNGLYVAQTIEEYKVIKKDCKKKWRKKIRLMIFGFYYLTSEFATQLDGDNLTAEELEYYKSKAEKGRRFFFKYWKNFI